MSFSSIRKKLDSDNPHIFQTIGNERKEIVGDEREKWLDDNARQLNDYSWNEIRTKRNSLLVASDWTQIPDAPVDAKAWAAYRQALRDLPAKIKDPTAEVAWPEPPK